MFARLAVSLRGGAQFKRMAAPVENPALLQKLAPQAKALGLKAAPVPHGGGPRGIDTPSARAVHYRP